MQEYHPVSGLQTSEVLERRTRGLGSVSPPTSGRSSTQIFRENVLTTVNIILFSIALALVLLGQYLDALISVGVISFNMIISLIQEVRAKHILDRISLLHRPKILVLRDGQATRIEPEELVVGDIVILQAGDQIVADGPVVGDTHIEVDESLLTGESDLIVKGKDDSLYSGTFCVTGHTYYRAEKVGRESVAGELTTKTRAYRAMYTPLQQEVNLIVRILLFVALFLEVLLVASALVSFIPIVETVRMAMVIIGIVPNGLFLSISVTYALEALHIAGKGVLVQRFNAIESLSHVDVLCTDKTGTLTTNELEVVALHPYGMDETTLRLILGRYVSHASSRNATSQAIESALQGQPVQDLHVCEEIPFSSARKWSALVIDDPVMHGFYTLGAPEILQPFLLPDSDLGSFVEQEAAQGRRVLLFAYSGKLPQMHPSLGETHPPQGLTPLGAVSLQETLRSEARETLAQFVTLGVLVKVISGDHPQTVAALAQQIGLGTAVRSISGTELEQIDDTQLTQTVEETTIFGRITPQQKARVVQALRKSGHYVAMIGDGVNDLLALKQANLGIAMQAGSQATRSAADLVLLQDTFAPLPLAVLGGQRIRNGMQDILKLFLARVATVTLLLIAIAFVGSFPFQPRQTSLLTLFTVGVPSLAFAYWARPGRVARENSLHEVVRFVLPVAFLTCLIALGVYLAVLIPASRTLPVPANPYREGALPLAQTALTVFSVLSGLILVIFVEPPSRSRPGATGHYNNWPPTLLVLALTGILSIILAIPQLYKLFNLQALDAGSYLVIAAAILLWTISLKTLLHFRILERIFSLT